MGRRSSYVSGALYLYFVQAVQYLIPFLIIPILTAALGVSEFGVLMYWTAVMAGFSIVVDFGFGYVGGRELAKREFDFVAVSELYFSILGARFLVFVVASVLLYLIVFLSPDRMQVSMVYPLVLSGLVGALISPNWLLLALRMTGCVALSGFSGQLFLLLGSYFFVENESDIWVALLVQCFSPLVSSIFASLFVFFFVRPDCYFVSINESVSMLVKSFRMFLATSSAAAYSAINPFIVGFFLAPDFVSAFALAERIVKAFIGLISPVLSALYPYSIRRAQGDGFWDGRITIAVLISAVILVVLLNVVAESLVLHFGGVGFSHAVPIVRVLSFNIFFVVIGNVAGIHWLGAKGYDRSVLAVTGIAAILYVVFFPLIISRAGIVAGAWGLLAIEVFVGLGLFLIALIVKNKGLKI